MPADDSDRHGSSVVDRASRRWRTIWRMHFYAGLLAAPFLVLLALTGLVILYTGPIQQATQGELRNVTPTGTAHPYDELGALVAGAFPDRHVTSLVVPDTATTSVAFGLDSGRQVFVDQYTGTVLGTADPHGGVIGLANRLHGNLNNGQLKVPFLSIGALFGNGGWIKHYVLGDMILELVAGWVLMLAVSGVYLWWPRRSRTATPASSRRSLSLLPRRGTVGRARWRDLHAIPGVAYAGLLALTIVSGLLWADHWGSNFTAVANRISANRWVDTPHSAQPTLGSIDRQGSRIPWNTGNAEVPGSPGASAGAARIGLDRIAAIGNEVGMKPGFTISLPEDGTDEAGNPTYGSFTLSNSWPRATGDARSVFVDQFSGVTISEMNAYGYGAVSYAGDTLVSVHMGTQFGVVDRILMTALCVGTIWSVISGLVMYLRRRRRGTLGLPRRPGDVRLANRLIALAAVGAVVFPLWGLSLMLALAVDRFVIRRSPRLRPTFGQR